MAFELQNDIDSKNDIAFDKSKPKENIDYIDYDRLLSSAGEFGRYQVLLLFSTFPFYMFGVHVYFSQLFMTEVSQNHWCRIPDLENLTDIDRRNLAIPKDVNSKLGYSHCEAYVGNWTEVLETGQIPDDTWKTMPCQNGWEFNRTEIPYPTISSELGWVCEKSSYQATAQSFFSVGSIIGGFLIGWVSDRYGRIPAVVASNLIGCVGGVSSTFAKNLIQFTICRIIVGMAYNSCMMMVFLLSLEYMAPKYRSVLSNMTFGIFYSLFTTTLPFIVLACGHWKTISLVTSLPLAFAILTPLFVPESPRWLLSKGRVDDAISKVLTIGRINRKEVSPALIQQFKETVSNEEKEEIVSILEVFKRPLLRNILIIVCVEYMCCQIVFDGLIRSLGQLDFDFFLSFAASSITELPSIVLCACVMDFFGRRWLTFVVLTISGVFSVLTVLVGSGIPSVVCSVVARFAVNMSCNTVAQWSAELMPTPVRGSGTSLVNICSYVGVMISPYIVYLKVYSYWLPLVIIGALAGLGAILALLLPETANKKMPHTFGDAEELAKSYSLWEMPCLKRASTGIDRDGHVNPSFEMS